MIDSVYFFYDFYYIIKMFFTAHRNSQCGQAVSVMDRAGIYGMYFNMHVHKFTCDIKHDAVPVYSIDIKSGLGFDLDIFIPVRFYPAFRFLAVLNILRHIHAVTFMDGKPMTSCDKADYLLAGERRTASCHFNEAVVYPLHDDAVSG